MATLLIRDVPEALYRKLKLRAKQRGTSMNKEAVRLLAEGLELPLQTPEDFLASLQDLRRRLFRRRPAESVATTLRKMRASR